MIDLTRLDDDLPLNDTFVRFHPGEVDVTINGQTFKAQLGSIGDGHGTPIEVGILVLRLASDVDVAIARAGGGL